MTREEVIEQLKKDRDLCNFNPMTGEEEPMNGDCRKSAEALDIAIKVLEQDSSEDAVSRQAVLDTKVLIELPDGQSFYCISPEDVEELSSVTPTRKKGKWIFHEKSISTGFKDLRECSCCRCYFRWEMPRNSYCPNCGARMTESEEV